MAKSRFLIKDKTIYIGIIILIIVSFLTIGYSAFIAEFSVSNTVAYIRPEKVVRITNALYENSSNANMTNLDYSINSIISDVILNDVGSYVTYKIDVTNLGNAPVAISNVDITDGTSKINNLDYEFIDYTKNNKLCNNNNKCTNNITKTLYLKIYLKNSSNISNYHLVINLTFTEVYTITYNDNFQGETLSGSTYTYTFTNNDAPTNISITSGTYDSYTYDNNVLSIINVGSDLVLTGTIPSSGGGTLEEPYINTEDKEYNPKDLPKGYTKYVNVLGAPLINVDENGNITSFEFTNVGDNGILFDEDNHSINTGIIAFDGNPFTIHLKFKATINNNVGKHILAALSSTQNKYTGFIFYVYKTANIRVNALNNATISSAGYGGTNISYFNLPTTSSSKETEYTVDITYDPNSKKITTTMNPGNNSGTSQTESKSSTVFPDTLNSATITVGGNGVNDTYDVNEMTVLEFSVNKS